MKWRLPGQRSREEGVARAHAAGRRNGNETSRDQGDAGQDSRDGGLHWQMPACVEDARVLRFVSLLSNPPVTAVSIGNARKHSALPRTFEHLLARWRPALGTKSPTGPGRSARGNPVPRTAPPESAHVSGNRGKCAVDARSCIGGGVGEDTHDSRSITSSVLIRALGGEQKSCAQDAAAPWRPPREPQRATFRDTLPRSPVVGNLERRKLMEEAPSA